MKRNEKFQKVKIENTNQVNAANERPRGVATTYKPAGTNYQCVDRWYLFASNNMTGVGHTDYSTLCV